MTMILDYAPGASLSDPTPWSVVRAHPTVGATSFSKAGLVALSAVNVIRDNHYINGVRTTLLEPSTVNLLLQSQAWGTTWVPNTLSGTINNQGAAPDGTTTASAVVPDGTSSSQHGVGQAVTVAAGDFFAAACFLKANGYTGAQIVVQGTSGFATWFMDTALGTIAVAGNSVYAATGAFAVPLGNGWFWFGVWGRTATDTSVTVRVRCFDTAAHAQTTTAFVGNGSGMLGWGAQFEHSNTVPLLPTSYVATTTVALGRDNDVVSTPWPIQTVPVWGYVKFFDLGWSQRAAFEDLLSLCDASLGNPRFRLTAGSGSVGAAPSHRANYASGVGTKQSAAILTPGVDYQDSVELFWQLFGDGSVGLQRSINGGAVASVVDAGASPDFMDFAAKVSTGIVLFLNTTASMGLVRLKLGLDPTRITTLAQGAAA
jgi:hypothetical protein